MLECPEMPVGGRLKKIVNRWEKITNDNWVLETLNKGLKFEFEAYPKPTGIRQTYVPVQNLEIYSEEVQNLLQKEPITHVPFVEKHQCFYSTLFLVPKKTGDQRPVINLKPLNSYLVKRHFKMDTLAKVLNLVHENDWAVSLDLKDAYFHIPVHPSHQKYLRFCILGQCFQFQAMCFGPTQAPRVFTKVVSVVHVAAHLRMHNIRLVAYLDDWLVVNKIKHQLIQDREKVLNLLTHLGFIINVKKSQLVPCQEIVYLGSMFKLNLGQVCPTKDRIQSLVEAMQLLTACQTASAMQFLRVLGIMASCIELIPYARLRMRPIQIHLLHFWKPASKDLDFQVPITQHLKEHLHWWFQPANTLKGRFLHQWCATKILTTDASKTGYGAHLEGQYCQGTWSKKESSLHINVLELEAVHRALVHFLPVLKNQKVLVRSDNVTVVQYLNKQGGTRSPNLCFRVWNLFLFAIQNQIELRAAHIAGKLNFLAYHSSRKQIRPSEWSINNQVINQIFALWNKPLIDLFASAQNHKTPVFCTWFPSQEALAVYALSFFMGGNVRLCISSHRTNSESSGTHVTVQLPDDSDSSLMATSSLVHKVASTSDRHSKKSSAKRRSSNSAKHKDISPKSRSSETIGMAALNSNFKSAGFSKKVRKLLAASWRKGTKKDYCCKF